MDLYRSVNANRITIRNRAWIDWRKLKPAKLRITPAGLHNLSRTVRERERGRGERGGNDTTRSRYIRNTQRKLPFVLSRHERSKHDGQARWLYAFPSRFSVSTPNGSPIPVSCKLSVYLIALRETRFSPDIPEWIIDETCNESIRNFHSTVGREFRPVNRDVLFQTARKLRENGHVCSVKR